MSIRKQYDEALSELNQALSEMGQAAADAIENAMEALAATDADAAAQIIKDEKANPFPMSIYDNITYGPKLHGVRNKAELDEIVESSLRGAALWEEVKDRLKKNYTVVIVTHNMQQAARISDRTAFFLLGELVEVGPTEEIFSTPSDKRTEDYISGRFG